MLKTVISEVVKTLGGCHVCGAEAKKFGDAIEALKEIIKIIDMSEKGENDEHYDEQRKHV